MLSGKIWKHHKSDAPAVNFFTVLRKLGIFLKKITKICNITVLVWLMKSSFINKTLEEGEYWAVRLTSSFNVLYRDMRKHSL